MKSKVTSFVLTVDFITDWTGKIVSLLLVPMCLLLAFEVIMRYGFNSPTRFSHELSTFLFGGIGMLGGAYTYLYKGHVTLDIIYGRLTSRKKALLDIITSPLFFFFCIALIWEGWNMAYGSLMLNEHTSTPWGPPLYPLKFIIPIASLLLFFQGVAKLIRDVFTVITGKELS